MAAFLGSPIAIANKQAETVSPETLWIRTAQWGGLCSGSKVVWETLGSGWEVFSREMDAEREVKEALPLHFPLSRGKQHSTMSFSPQEEAEAGPGEKEMQRGMAQSGGK